MLKKYRPNLFSEHLCRNVYCEHELCKAMDANNQIQIE